MRERGRGQRERNIGRERMVNHICSFPISATHVDATLLGSGICMTVPFNRVTIKPAVEFRGVIKSTDSNDEHSSNLTGVCYICVFYEIILSFFPSPFSSPSSFLSFFFLLGVSI